MGKQRRVRRGVMSSFVVAAAVLTGVAPITAEPAGAPLSAITVGGGPNPELNQVAIESNVRYVDSILPDGAQRRVLFADGRTETADVRFHEAQAAPVPRAETALRLILEGPGAEDGADRFRKPHLRTLDGPATREAFGRELAHVAEQKGKSPVLLYFTGHGSRNPSGDLNNNAFGLWNDKNLTVRDLASEVEKLPADRPLVLVMVQCFGGAFGNVLFAKGDPEAGVLADRPLCGFFATTRERVAAGCTPEVDEADYRDFTGYFFAALAGKDRLGRPVASLDCNHDGVIGMDEAFAYALVNEPSIDVPVSTSDVFLRRFEQMPDDEAATLHYSHVLGMANPAQKAALEGLSHALNAAGEDRLQVALADVRSRGPGGDAPPRERPNTAYRDARELLSSWRGRLLRRFPGLESRSNPGYGSARVRALAYMAERTADLDRIMAADTAVNAEWDARYQDELRGARWLRLIRVAKTVVLEKRLRESGDKKLIARFDRLRALESANPLHRG